MKKIISLLLALALLCGAVALASCGDEGSDVTTEGTQETLDTGSQTEGTTNSTELPDPFEDSDIGEKKLVGFEHVDFGGKIFTFEAILNRADWNCYEVAVVDEDASDSLSMAIMRRNDTICELYNCGIEQVTNADGILANDFATEQCHIDIGTGMASLGNLGTGQWYNYHTLGIDLTNPWWDQGFVNDVTVDGRLYAILGDFSLTSFDATWVLFFNKEVLDQNEKLRGTDFYSLVKNNEWTIDKFTELVQKAKQDDGDQIMTTGTADIYGYISSTFGIRGLYFGAGGTYVTKTDDAAGNTTFKHGFNDNASLVAQAVIDIYADDASTIAGYTTVGSQFTNGLALFAPETLDKARNWSEAGLKNFGVLPHPVYSEEQLQSIGYKHNVDNHAIYYIIPKTINYDLSIIANFLEVYGFHSRYIVYPEFLNLYKYNWTNSEEDAEMIDIIMNTRTYDLGYQLNFAGVDAELIAGVQGGTNIIAQLGAELGSVVEERAQDYKDWIKSTDPNA
ncbi:MAG: hypothetical protein E7608_06705 [Ruminococcaceae bacterium]|nr:hypothetical protein [Oscillospiraceae bacterium]